MTVLATRNRYLVTTTGRFVGTRALPSLFMLTGFAGGPALAVAGAALGMVLESPAVMIGSGLLGIGGFIATVVALWVFLLGGQRDVAHASKLWLAGDSTTPIPLCQRPLGRVFRAD